MAVSSKRLRPLFTLAFVAFGCLGGHFLALRYFGILDSYLKGESSEFLWIQQNPTALSPADRLFLRVSFLLVGALVGFVVERLAFIQSHKAHTQWERMSPQDKLCYFVGVPLGLVLTALIRNILVTPGWITIALAILLCYVCVVSFESLKEQIRFYFPGSMPAPKGQPSLVGRPKILDTNVIIDGRIADVCRAGFVEGPIYVPKFVLEELQQIADSSDSLKRARGRRGLEILKQMQNEMELEVPSFSVDESAEEVDARLVIVAREIGGKIITNDYNLNKVAELQGVEVLNVNELANALKPVVLPGEEMKVTIIKEGKEKEQGIGYLDDGTMIVVEGARRLIGETMDVCVTSVLQTVQGKMIFGKTKEDSEENYSSIDGSIRSYTSGRPRRKIR